MKYHRVTRGRVAETKPWHRLASCAGLLVTCLAGGGEPPGAAGEDPRFSLIRNADTLAVVLRVPAAGTTYALQLHSDRNAPVPRFSDVSPRTPAARQRSTEPERESWFPVVDVAVSAAMEAVIELASLPEGTQLSWNGWIQREAEPARTLVRIPAERLQQWENTLWINRHEPRLTRFYLRLPFPRPAADQPWQAVVRILTPDWSGRVEVVARDEAGREAVVFTWRIEAMPPTSQPLPEPTGSGLEASRLRASLAAVVGHTLASQIVDPQSPMQGGLYLFYDLDARTYRTPHWVWGWGPSVGLLLKARQMPEIAALFGADRMLEAAEKIGEASLRTVKHDPAHLAHGIPISRWDRSPRFDFGHELAITPCDAAFLAGWAWVPLWEATGDVKWKDASITLAGALKRLMAEFPIPPQNYWPDYGRWDTKVIDEAGFGVELFAELYRATGDDRMRAPGRRYIEQHIKALGRSDGLWDRTHFLDGQPNTPTIRMTRGLGWPMEGLLAAHRLLPEGGRYLELAGQMAEHLLATQKPEGWWVHRFDQAVEEWGVGTKGTALWCWLFYELHRHSEDPRHLAAARRALRWLLDNQDFGDDPFARGGHVTVSPHSAVGYRAWYRVTCTYGAAFYGLALGEELRVQQAAAGESRR